MTPFVPSIGFSEQAATAAHFVCQRWAEAPRAGIILGTGLGQLAEHIERAAVIPYHDIPGFPRSTALSHKGQFVCGRLAGAAVIAMEGRFHFYEGYSAEQITLPVAVMRNLGAELLIASNASGGLNPRFRSGEIMALADHIDWMGRRTAELSRLGNTSNNGPRYAPQWIDLAQDIARRGGFVCHRGTYLAVLGPNYETRAEYRAMRRIGADAVGMSTVPEVLVAARHGMSTLALSTITNVARPDAPTSTAAQEVVDIAATAEPRLRQIVTGVLRYLADSPKLELTERMAGPKCNH